jgi:hypothetical protein
MINVTMIHVSLLLAAVGRVTAAFQRALNKHLRCRLVAHGLRQHHLVRCGWQSIVLFSYAACDRADAQGVAAALGRSAL